MYSKILVPVDGTETAALGLAEAIKLAKHVRRLVMGSDAEFVVRHTSVPVLLVRNQISTQE